MITIAEALTLAVDHHNAGRLNEAEAVYRNIIDADPNNSDALHLLGVIANQVGQYDVAAGLIRQAIALHEDVAVYHWSLGVSLKALGRLNEAAVAMSMALVIEPVATKYIELGVVHYTQGQLQEAAASFRNAVVTDPRNADGWSNLGGVLYFLGQLPEAEEALRQAITIRPGYFDALANLGFVAQKMGKIDEAIASYQRAIVIKPDYIHAHLRLRRLLNSNESKFVFEETGGNIYERSMTTDCNSYYFFRRGEKTIIKLALDHSERSQGGISDGLLKGRFYAQEVVLFMLDVLDEGDIVVDVGANFGFFTVLMGKMVGECGRVISIEANPRHEALLKHHILVNRIPADIRLVAVSNYVGMAEFSDFGPNCGHGTLVDKLHYRMNRFGVPSKPFTVRVATLDSEIQALGCGCPKLIKMDAAGSELEAMQGAVALLRSENLEFVIVYCRDVEHQMELRRYMYANNFDTYIFHENGGGAQLIDENSTIINIGVGHMLFARRGVMGKYFPFIVSLRTSDIHAED